MTSPVRRWSVVLHRVGAVVTAALLFTAVPGLAAPASAADVDVTVMTRNLYLGADVAEALSLVPDMAAAAQSLWDQVAATDFTARVPVLAQEAAQARPDVIGIQEATRWECTPSAFASPTVVYDFTAQFLEATRAAGTPYVLASVDGATAENPSFTIPAIPLVTRVSDPATFQPLFGTDTAYCGFTIGDALVVREDLAPSVLAAGTVEYARSMPIVPLVLDVVRGYAWADVAIDGTPVRFVTTHLEAFWAPDAMPAAADQARQLVADLQGVQMPLVVMGDFNSDPRDPRAPGDNPGGQPETGAACPAQSGTDATCSAYWTMTAAGFADAGPDATDPRNLSWGASALLAGPDLERLAAAQKMGNPWGMTDRLDYVWTRNGATASKARLVGADWPVQGETWACRTDAQLANAEAAARAMDADLPQSGVCMPTDHAGVVATLAITAGGGQDAALVDRSGPNWGRVVAVAVLVGLVVLLVVGIRALRRRRRRRRSGADDAGGDAA
jgi:endonuclease/exonuclease/phosphatase (EEP) superfamily protein YafD